MVRNYFLIEGFDINAEKNSIPFLLGELDLFPIALMDNLLQESDAQVVISSSWRSIAPGFEWFKELFELRGAKILHQRIVGVTPQLNHLPLMKQRGEEVQQYIKQVSFAGRYICIDDCLLPYREDQPTIETNPAIGFTLENLQDSLELLGNH